MNTPNYNRYLSALVSQNKFEIVIESFNKMDAFNVKQTPASYANAMTAYARLDNR